MFDSTAASLDKLYNMLYNLCMSNLIAISEAREKLPELVNKINKLYDRAIITVNGKPKVVMISLEELESLEETAEVLAIPGIKESIDKGRKEAKKGQGIPLSKLV